MSKCINPKPKATTVSMAAVVGIEQGGLGDGLLRYHG